MVITSELIESLGADKTADCTDRIYLGLQDRIKSIRSYKDEEPKGVGPADRVIGEKSPLKPFVLLKST